MRAKKFHVQRMVPLRTEQIARKRSPQGVAASSALTRRTVPNRRSISCFATMALLGAPLSPRERPTSPAASAAATKLPRVDFQTSTWVVTPRSRSKAALAFK
jgi:hypothetical protein